MKGSVWIGRLGVGDPTRDQPTYHHSLFLEIQNLVLHTQKISTPNQPKMNLPTKWFVFDFWIVQLDYRCCILSCIFHIIDFPVTYFFVRVHRDTVSWATDIKCISAPTNIHTNCSQNMPLNIKLTLDKPRSKWSSDDLFQNIKVCWLVSDRGWM